MQAGQQRRTVALPGTARRMDAGTGQFVASGRSIQVSSNSQSAPIYWQEGHIIPMQLGERRNQANDLLDVELHVVLGAGSPHTATLHYTADDGQSFGYQRGETSRCTVRAQRQGDEIEVWIDNIDTTWRPLRLRVVAYDGATRLRVHGPAGEAVHGLSAHAWAFSGAALACSLWLGAGVEDLRLREGVASRQRRAPAKAVGQPDHSMSPAATLAGVGSSFTSVIRSPNTLGGRSTQRASHCTDELQHV